MKISIKELTHVLKGQLILGDPKSEVVRASIDSRKLKPGDLFFALKGEKTDGHNFVMGACRMGAAGVVVQDLKWLKSSEGFTSGVIKVAKSLEALHNLAGYIRNRFKGSVVGITGSNGKTTTKEMTTSIFKKTGPGLSTAGNYNSQIGLPLVLSELKEKDKWMVLELGATEPGHIHKLTEIVRPQIGVITSIGPAHLATFGSLTRIAESKWELIESLPSDGTAILPWNEPMLEPMIRKFRNKIIFFGDDSSCPVRASAIEIGEKTKFMLHLGPASMEVTLPMAGRFNVNNALAAAGAAWAAGISHEKIVQGLEDFSVPLWRMNVIHHKTGGILVNDSYNANPASMVHSIRSFVETYADRKKFLVLGSMLELGGESEKLHFHVGSETAHFDIEKVFLLGPETKSIKEGFIAAGGDSKKIKFCQSKEEALSDVSSHLNKNSAILFKGSRGVHLDEMVTQIIPDSIGTP